ncbi:MAG: nitrogenase component 1 [Agathobacter sp.]|nr:nitrogenase component 1 [Agathobacter sp.]
MSEKKCAVYYTAEELTERGKENIPTEFVSADHLIYSSPATLAFNSPGAEGFGVKRAGLAVPESVMLIVSPGCCGRNTSLISKIPEYNNRFFYLTMDETDIITGRHLKKIPQAVREIVDFLDKKPSVVMICITCVDALLGTDMERVCKKAEEETQIQVRPCYMYALTREGRKPPMVHVRQSIYSLLAPAKRNPAAVDILGFFAPLDDTSEIYAILHALGVKKTMEISRMKTYEEYLHMSEANFALVLNPEARFAARDFEERLSVPSIELTRFYDIDRIQKQYAALGKAIGRRIDDTAYYQKAKDSVEQFYKKFGPVAFSVGECLNADPFELSLALLRYGHVVPEIFGTITAENFVYIKHIAQISPDTRVYSNLHPSMIFYEENAKMEEEKKRNFVSLGKDAGYYHESKPNLAWNSDVQPYGYQAVEALFGALYELLDERDDGGREERS